MRSIDLRPIWKGDSVIIIGAGPSLSKDQLQVAERACARSIVINTSYARAPWASMLYAADAKWWEWNAGAKDFTGERVTTDISAAERWGLRYARGRSAPGLSGDPDYIHWGPSGAHHSGLQAINIATLRGASAIYLLGFDLQANAKGQRHWHPEHPDRLESDYPRWRGAYAFVARDAALLGIAIWNATPGSAITAFPRVALADAFRLKDTA